MYLSRGDGDITRWGTRLAIGGHMARTRPRAQAGTSGHCQRRHRPSVCTVDGLHVVPLAEAFRRWPRLFRPSSVACCRRLRVPWLSGWASNSHRRNGVHFSVFRPTPMSRWSLAAETVSMRTLIDAGAATTPSARWMCGWLLHSVHRHRPAGPEPCEIARAEAAQRKRPRAATVDGGHGSVVSLLPWSLGGGESGVD